MKDYFEMEKDTFNREVAATLAEPVHVLAGQAAEKPLHVQAAEQKQKEQNQSFTNLKAVENLTIEMFGCLVSRNYGRAEETLLGMVKDVLLAAKHGQLDTKDLANQALKALETYNHYQEI